MALKPTAPWAPADEGVAVTKSDTVDIPGAPSSGAKIFVGTTGDVAVNLAVTGTGTALVFKNVPSGTFLPLLVTRVRSTNTTATDIVAVW